MRLSNEELTQIKEKYGVDTLWSWSRLEKARMSKNEFYLAYVKHEKEDRNDCVYATMGGLCHDTLEKLYEDQIEYNDMIQYFDENWIAVIDIMDLKFDRNDAEKNRSISVKYKDDLEHFFTHHDKIKQKVYCEKFILTDFDGVIFQGYADAIFKDNDGKYNIIDFKTSTKYTASTMKEKCGQLVCYALGLHQSLKVPFEDIRIAWNFLKYVNVEYEQANGKIASKSVERRELAQKIITPVKMWLKKFGYTDESDKYVEDMILSNSIDDLPDDVKQKFKISDCYVYVDLDQSLIDYWSGIVKETVSKVNGLMKEYNEKLLTDKEHADEIWLDSIEDVERESYYYATLSGYSANLNKSYRRYLEYLDQKKNGEDLFNGVGSDVDDDWLNMLSSINDSEKNDKDNDGVTNADNSIDNDSDDSWLSLLGSSSEFEGQEEGQSEGQEEVKESTVTVDEEDDFSWLNGLFGDE